MSALVYIPVGVVVDRIKSDSPWVDHIWQVTSVMAGEPAAEPWTRLSGDDERMSFYAGAISVALYPSETGHYRDNLAGENKLWVVMTPTEIDPPYRLELVTADPAEGEGYTETGVYLVEAVAMPEPVREALADFVARHHVDGAAFHKRKRDRADPEALGRRGPPEPRRSDD